MTYGTRRVELSEPGYWVEIHTDPATLKRATAIGVRGKNAEALAVAIAAWNLDGDDGPLPITAEAAGVLFPADEQRILRAVREAIEGPGYGAAPTGATRPPRASRRGKRRRR